MNSPIPETIRFFLLFSISSVEFSNRFQRVVLKRITQCIEMINLNKNIVIISTIHCFRIKTTRGHKAHMDWFYQSVETLFLCHFTLCIKPSEQKLINKSFFLNFKAQFCVCSHPFRLSAVQKVWVHSCIGPESNCWPQAPCYNSNLHFNWNLKDQSS